MAAGGVILDMGYHSLDVLSMYFGMPHSYDVKVGYKFEQMKKQQLEDSAQLVFSYKSTGTGKGELPFFTGTLSLNRHSLQKTEYLRIDGSLGTLYISPESCRLFLASTATSQDLLEGTPPLSKTEVTGRMMDFALSTTLEDLESAQARNRITVQVIEGVYAKASKTRSGSRAGGRRREERTLPLAMFFL